jgi:hypothetical protein
MPSKEQKAIARHALRLGFEQDHEEHVDSGVDISFDPEDWSIETVDTTYESDGTFAYEIEAEQSSRQTEKVRRSTRVNPPEYKNHDVTLLATVTFVPEGNNYFGDSRVVIEQMGGIPNPPDPR